MSNSGIVGLIPWTGQDEGVTWLASSLPCASAGSRRVWGQQGAPVIPCAEEKDGKPNPPAPAAWEWCFPMENHQVFVDLLLAGGGERPEKPLWGFSEPWRDFSLPSHRDGHHLYPQIPEGCRDSQCSQHTQKMPFMNCREEAKQCPESRTKEENSGDVVAQLQLSSQTSPSPPH